MDSAAMTQITELRPHPRNYREHPDDQIAHLMHSIREHGFYRNVVTTVDGTILAGHGVVKAAARLELTEVPVVRLPLDPDDPRALQILAGDNYASHLAEDDDRMLTELLKELAQVDALLGTGFDELSLAALAMVTRSAAEIGDFDAAAEWAGMPSYDGAVVGPRIVIEFEDDDQRQRWIDRNTDLFVIRSGREHGHRLISCRWAETPEEGKFRDTSSILFEG